MFTASIDLTLNMLVKGFPGSDGILLLRPKIVLIGKLLPHIQGPI
jgi:hypothetical protein